jgi:hypothetical protein
MILPLLQQGGIGQQLGQLGAVVILGALVGLALYIGFFYALGQFFGNRAAGLARRVELGDAVMESPLSIVYDRASEVEGTVGAIVRYTVYTLALITPAAFAAQTFAYDSVWPLTTYFVSVLGGVVVVLVGFVVAGYVGQTVKESDVIGSTGFTGLFAEVAKGIVYFVSVTLGLDALGFSTAILNTLAQAVAIGVGLGVAIAIGVAFGLGSQDYVAARIEGWVEQG